MNCCKYFALCLLSCALCGCAAFENLFSRDPLTGGVNAGASELLGCPVPGGMQLYPSHSVSGAGPTGAAEGLETYRGSMTPAAAGLAMHNNLKQAGWQLRLSLRGGNRYLYVYALGNRLAVVAIHTQGMLTIMEIWTGEALPDGSELSYPNAARTKADDAVLGEGFPDPPSETFGLEERDL